MAIHLDEYQELLDDLPQDSLDVLRAAWNEAGTVTTTRSTPPARSVS